MSQFKDLVALDDWGTVATWAMPLIEKYGEQGISWIWNKFFGTGDK
jgi:hypothetical protein